MIVLTLLYSQIGVDVGYPRSGVVVLVVLYIFEDLQRSELLQGTICPVSRVRGRHRSDRNADQLYLLYAKQRPHLERLLASSLEGLYIVRDEILGEIFNFSHGLALLRRRRSERELS